MGAEKAQLNRETAGVPVRPDKPVAAPYGVVDFKAPAQLAAGWGDGETARMYADLGAKQAAGELTIAFCGHFSAGKSSMVNALCGSPLLPSGPVPTSANVVSIRSGPSRILVYPNAGQDTANAEPFETTADGLARYCLAGGEYSAVDIWEPLPLLGNHGVLMDTPGVDSTDESHRRATDSALHLADAVIYVMDYNHVQSEHNLAFAKSLSDWGKPLYLVVNQIDKHRERELAMSDYKNKVESAFRDWGVTYAGLLFTSLKQPDHAYNQFQSLRKLIGELLERRTALLRHSLAGSAHHAAKAALERLEEETREEREQLQEQAEGQLSDEIEGERDALRQAINGLADMPDRLLGELRAELDALLDNANLMPAEIREAAGQYAASLDPNFRMGLFFTAAKRDRERNIRLSVLTDLLSRQLSAALDVHAAKLLRDWSARAGLPDGAGLAAPEWPAVTGEWLAGQVRPDTGSEGEALLSFCRKLAAELKAGRRRAVLAAADERLAKLPPLLEERRRDLRRREAALGGRARAAAALQSLARVAEARARELAALLPPRRTLTAAELPAVDPLPLPAPGVRAAEPSRPPRRGAAVQPAAPAAAGISAAGRGRLAGAAAALREAACAARAEAALAGAAAGLEARADDLARGRFTVALFGAFSAGKSSFANALLGEEALPVSPHPATAAVTRILAPAAGRPHGTALVRMKTADEVWDDIVHGFQVLQLGDPLKEKWRQAVKDLPLGGLHPAVLPVAGFLRAAAAGWDGAQALLGAERTVELDEFRAMVADEKKACFVSSIDLHYGCALTESGIILVDTPGADSVHARHTGVAFRYMKEADAIVFLTYYNHAFSKADRSLLTQLGRVKSSFALDKMFFIINAADLAQNEAELAGVRSHVSAGLKQLGVVSPRLLGLSSLQALEAKLTGDRGLLDRSGFAAFEEALGRYAGEELPGLSLTAARAAVARLRERAEEYAALASGEAGRRKERSRELAGLRSAAQRELAGAMSNPAYREAMSREAETLLFHVRRRLDIGFGPAVLESFHPSLLREDQGSLKERFAACGRELWRSLQRELEQELWATTLRLAAEGNRLIREAMTETARRLGAGEEELPYTELPAAAWPSPPGFSDAVLTPADWQTYWRGFRNPRHFFEGPGRSELRHALEPVMRQAVAAASEAGERLLQAFYAEALTCQLERAVSQALAALQEREQALLEIGKGGDAAARWSGLVRTLAELERRFD